MNKLKLVRITTVPKSLEKLLEGQLEFMSDYYEVTAVSSDKDRLERYGLKNNTNIFYLDLTRKITPIKDFKAILRFYKFLRKEKPFIVHSHTPKAGLIAMVSSYFAGVPNRLHTVAGLPLMEATGAKRFILNFVEKLTYKAATGVYPNSRGLYDFILRSKFTQEDKLKIIGNGSSNGIDTKYFNPENYTGSFIDSERAKLSISRSDFVFIFVGRLVKDKGINELVKAFENLHKSNKNVKLLLVGALEEDLDPLETTTMLSISNNNDIIYAGYQNDVRPFFALSQVLVFPSYREGFPNVVMQAGAMGLPSIVSNINGCNEIIKNDVNGLIVPPKNPELLLDAMDTMLNNHNEFKKMKSVSRIEMLSKYSRNDIWNYILDEYKTLKRP